MEDKEHHSEAGSQFGEGSEQSHGIGAAADGHADALAGTDEAMLAQIMFERLKHRNIITEERVRGFGSPTCAERHDADLATPARMARETILGHLSGELSATGRFDPVN